MDSSRAYKYLEALVDPLAGSDCGKSLAWLSANSKKVTDLLGALAQDDDAVERIAARSYIHPNGFVKIVLVAGHMKLRLHCWSSSADGEVRGNLHSHRWELASVVLSGAMAVRLYEPGEAHHMSYQEWRYAPESNGDSESLEHVGLAHLRLTQEVILLPGSGFASPSPTIHSARPIRDMTRTLVLHGPPVVHSTRVFADSGALARSDGLVSRPSAAEVSLHLYEAWDDSC